MKNGLNHIVFAVAILLVASCAKTPERLPANEILGWMAEKDHGLVSEKKIAEITVAAEYRSPEAMALMRTGPNPDSKEWKKALEDAGDMQYYMVSYRLNNSGQDIMKYNLHDESEYFARSNYLSFGIDKDVYVICGKDSLPCRLHQFTPHYGLSPKADLVFAFDDPDQSHQFDHTLVIEDQLFGLGILRFNFKSEDIKHTPSIAF